MGTSVLISRVDEQINMFNMMLTIYSHFLSRATCSSHGNETHQLTDFLSQMTHGLWSFKAAMRCTDQTMPPRSRHLICAVKLAVNELESHCSDAKTTTACTTHLWLCTLNQCAVHGYTAKKKVLFSLLGVNTLNRSLCRSSL